MADINNLFLTFNDTISLTKSKSDNLKKGRDSLRSAIKKWFSNNDKLQPVFCWQGSFAMKTTVNPLNGEYDLDDGVYLSGYSDMDMDEWPAISTVHTWIKTSVDGHTKQTPIDKDTCVRVKYASDYHIDYPIYIEKDDNIYLAHKAKGWTISDPKAFKDWFINGVKTEGEQLRSVVRYLKAWKDYKGIALKGIEITILATNNFSAYEGRDEVCLRSTVENIISSLENDFSCIKPVAPEEDLFENVSDTKKNNIINGLKTFSKKLKLAIDEEDPLEASNYMIKMFGDRFPQGESVEKSEAENYVRTSSPGILRHDGRSA